ncbi:unnamed protein product [Symbiodinium natans]|uniref:Uncharacterized protein n=1 Tax=Symbiodinium natans TaxID=878477 RepID=A0A812TP10_9DINO|nr:unnamed protein product [Symbiodinium natans]
MMSGCRELGLEKDSERLKRGSVLLAGPKCQSDRDLASFTQNSRQTVLTCMACVFFVTELPRAPCSVMSRVGPNHPTYTKHLLISEHVLCDGESEQFEELQEWMQALRARIANSVRA